MVGSIAEGRKSVKIVYRDHRGAKNSQLHGARLGLLDQRRADGGGPHSLPSLGAMSGVNYFFVGTPREWKNRTGQHVFLFLCLFQAQGGPPEHLLVVPVVAPPKSRRWHHQNLAFCASFDVKHNWEYYTWHRDNAHRIRMAKNKTPDDQPVHKFRATIIEWLKRPFVIAGLLAFPLLLLMVIRSPERQVQSATESSEPRAYAFTNVELADLINRLPPGPQRGWIQAEFHGIPFSISSDSAYIAGH